MTNGVYHYIKQAWKNPSEEHKEQVRKEMIAWRAGERIVKLEKPTRLDRARTLGYKAKKGILVFRVTLERGGRQKARPTTKRRSKRFNVKKILKTSYQSVAEQRVQKAHPNLEILNSYKLGKDGQFYFFEVIAVDKNQAEIKSDPQFKWLQSAANRFRALRGLTSSGIKSRGFMNKNPNLKIRPSARAWDRKGR
jgi:large subunit ribosomal protein L15e